MEAGLAGAVPDSRKLEIVREFAAPRELVWKMFADPYHLSRWWGPKGFTNPVVELDFRVGGRWYHVMRGPDGRDYPADSEFIEIVAPERIVYRNRRLEAAAFGGNPPPSFLRIITFEDLGQRTRLTLVAMFDTEAEREAVMRRGFREGTLEGFDKLDAHLAATGETE
jgi:uncharacterized protein YndB with AHSA1/START domain